MAVATGQVDRPPSLILRFLRNETPHGRICPQRWQDMVDGAIHCLAVGLSRSCRGGCATGHAGRATGHADRVTGSAGCATGYASCAGTGGY